MASSIDRVICVKNQVFVYKVPPRGSNRGYRAADWKLDEPDWVGRLRVVSGERECIIKLEDKDSGDLFAQCPVESYPGVAVEQVTDSSRYFVVRIKDEGGRSAFIGIGFTDRGDSFDLLVALQDHFKYVKREETQQQEAATFDTGPKLDLSFKEGQTIKINIKTKKNQEDDDDPIPSRTRGRPSGKGGGGLLPPPPAAGSTVKLIAPPRGPSAVGGQNSAAEASLFGGPPLAPAQSAPAAGGGLDLLADLTAPPSQPTAPFSQPQSDPWASLANRGSNPQQSQQSSANDWVQF